MSPHLKQQWCIPPEQNVEFVWRMEDVLAYYNQTMAQPFKWTFQGKALVA